jgi:hypothetical protein
VISQLAKPFSRIKGKKMREHIAVWSRILAVTETIFFAALLFLSPAYAGQSSQGQISLDFDIQRQILRGFQIVPVRLDLYGKDPSLVGLGSYIVNTTGCNDCHTHPNWAAGGNPYLGQPEQINAAEYLAGGREFTTPAGTFTSANITPDHYDRPAGLSLAGFLEVMRYGHDPRDPPGVLLQVMSWPLYRWKTDQELRAIYEYLTAIPSLRDNPNPGP